MRAKPGPRPSIWPLFLLVYLLTGCAGATYETTFDEIGAWPDQVRPDITGTIVDGAYVMTVHQTDEPKTYWAPAGRRFGDGIFSVDVTQLEGTSNNGYGLAFRIDEESEDFYAFEISGDGYAWIGWCEAGCAGANSATLLREWWFTSTAIRTGPGATNRLKIVADGPNFIFYINDFEIGRVSDDRLARGDIGLLIETLTLGEIAVAFDNVRVTRLSG